MNESDYKNIDWDSLKKPWTFEQCRIRYIYCDDEIPFRKLSRLSGRSVGLLGDWSSPHHEYNNGVKWLTQREQYKSEVRTYTHNKIIESKSTNLSEILSKTLKEHHHSQEIIRNYLYKLIMVKVRKLAAFEPGKTIEELEAEIESGKYFDADMEKKIKAFMLVKDGIEKTLGWDNYINVNTSISTLERNGYVILSGIENDTVDIEVK